MPQIPGILRKGLSFPGGIHSGREHCRAVRSSFVVHPRLEAGEMHRMAVAGLMITAALAACTKQEAPKTDTAKPAMAAANASATKLGEAPGMKTPESVRYDPELDVYYVSNINGNPSQHDGNGFIAIVRADSTGAPIKMLVEGGKNGAKLDAPKGLALSGDTLWVADINHVRAFNRRTGAPLADIDLSSQKAQFLNDVAIGGDGAV